jgi:hypothetical protein
MRSIAPRTGAPEVHVARDQEEYLEICAALYEVDGIPALLTRWTFTEEERRRIAEGEDLYLGVLTFGQPMQPVMIQVGPEGWTKETGATIPDMEAP